jgi:hypothetical protein
MLVAFLVLSVVLTDGLGDMIKPVALEESRKFLFHAGHQPGPFVCQGRVQLKTRQRRNEEDNANIQCQYSGLVSVEKPHAARDHLTFAHLK